MDGVVFCKTTLYSIPMEKLLHEGFRNAHSISISNADSKYMKKIIYHNHINDPVSKWKTINGVLYSNFA
jgi:hypothetical protein